MKHTIGLGFSLAGATVLGLIAAIGFCGAGCGGAPPLAPVLSVSANALDFGTTHVTLMFTVSNTGGGSLTWSISADKTWISVAPSTGSGDATVSATVDRSSLPPGESTATLSITSDGGDATVAVTATATPSSLVSPQALDFGRVTEALSLAITNTGTGALVWQCTPSDDWIAVAPASGTGDGTVNVTVDRTGLPVGESAGTVSVTSNDGDAVIPVTVGVNAPPTITALTADSPRVATGGSTTVRASVSDADGDVLTYAWSTAAGSVAGTGRHGVFAAPATPQDVTVTLTATDALGASDQRDVTIEVFPIGDMGIVISSDALPGRGQ